MIHNTTYFTWKPKSWGKNHIILYNNSFPARTGRRQQPPYCNDFNFPASTGRRLRPEGSCHSLVFQLPPEGGYDLLSLPRPATLIRRRLSNLWTCHTPKFAVDNLCTLVTVKSSFCPCHHCHIKHKSC